jgi:hypothetical protein
MKRLFRYFFVLLIGSDMFRPNPDNKTELKQVAGITVFLLN